MFQFMAIITNYELQIINGKKEGIFALCYYLTANVSLFCFKSCIFAQLKKKNCY
ncbi:hypothetical protein HMPREF2531_04618 [Bacteroides intestinalis]|uniref:Uncharacterized protein n=1 Tax=Bacteroides intestinalis TaxID=329854 RepID=A0A139KUH3_9BACE|nr:hypothetical protein HMPREF2531_04618 [Bacteroides intestinalis]